MSFVDDAHDEISATSREQVFNFIVDYKRANDGLSPTTREIANACAISISTVRYHMLRLEADNRIAILPRRGIQVTGGEWNLPNDKSR